MWMAKVAVVVVMSLVLVSWAPGAQADDPGEEVNGFEDQVVELVAETVDSVQRIVQGCVQGQPEEVCGTVLCMTRTPSQCIPIGDCEDVACFVGRIIEELPHLSDCTVEGNPPVPCEDVVCLRNGGGASCFPPVDPVGLIMGVLEGCPPCVTQTITENPGGEPLGIAVAGDEVVAVAGFVDVWFFNGAHGVALGIGTTDPCESWDALKPIEDHCVARAERTELKPDPDDPLICLGSKHVQVDFDLTGESPPELDVDVPYLRSASAC